MFRLEHVIGLKDKGKGKAWQLIELKVEKSGATGTKPLSYPLSSQYPRRLYFSFSELLIFNQFVSTILFLTVSFAPVVLLPPCSLAAPRLSLSP